MNQAETKRLCTRYQILPSHHWGQNFLVDERIIDRICLAAEADQQDLVLEIGPGLGHLTRALADTAGRIIALEIDERFLPALAEVLADRPNSCVIAGDALRIPLADLTRDWSGSVLLAANLPYYITTPLIEKSLCELPHCRRFLFMLQRDAADRLLAAPGSRAAGPLAILAALHGPARRLLTVSAASFWPQPHVDSCVVVIDRDSATAAAAPIDRPAFYRLLGSCFAQRRKTLLNSMRQSGTQPERLETVRAGLAALGRPSDVRAEQLSLAEWLTLYQRICPPN
jgi:16S rRNA (adenine1518-N6/adenine1519-N6)-dimethyltransferase